MAKQRANTYVPRLFVDKAKKVTKGVIKQVGYTIKKGAKKLEEESLNLGKKINGWGHDERVNVKKNLGLDDNVDSFAEAITMSLLHNTEINLTGGVLNKIKRDDGFLKLEKELINLILHDKKFKHIVFSFKGKKVVEFGGTRASGSMKSQLLDPFNPKYKSTWDVAKDELTWIVRHATISYTASIDKEGKTKIIYKLYDVFDVRPSIGRSKEYNIACEVLGFLYHDIAGGTDKLVIRANWSKEYDL